MITEFDDIYDLSKEITGIILETSTNLKPGDDLKVYVPLLMPDIKKGNPKKSNVIPLKTDIFKNDPSCKIKLNNNKIKELNYLIGKIDNSSIHLNTNKIQKNSVVRFELLNSKLSKSRIYIDI